MPKSNSFSRMHEYIATLPVFSDHEHHMILADNYDPVRDAFAGIGIGIPPDTLASVIIGEYVKR